MGGDLLKNGAQMRRFAIMAVRVSYKLVRNHPIFVGSVFWLLLLYRSFPFMFSVLVSASPVLVCTAILLGTLLSFGQPDIPDIDNDEITVSEMSNLGTGCRTFVVRDESFCGDDEGYISEREEVAEKAFEGEPLLDGIYKVDGVEQHDGFSCDLVPGDHNFREVGFGMQWSEEADKEPKKLGFTLENEGEGENRGAGRIGAYVDAEAFKKQDSLVRELLVENLDKYGSSRDSLGAGAGDNFESLLMPWKRLDGDHDGNDADGESLDSGSDGAESSSPDASLADILPMLDELHPLLESENPQHANLSHDTFGLPIEGSIKLHDSSVHSDVEADILKEGKYEAGDDDDDDEEDDQEEETPEVKEDETKSGITWTEDDEKNLMDLGISELERNQRLESLIARRRARKNVGMSVEKNLIDLDGMNLSFGVAPITTTKQNPFDLSHDSSYGMGLPPIPGSAPSALHPRQNPFDLPYDSGEEKPDLKGESFQEEILKFTQDEKEPIFRRHESFNLDSSSFEYPKYEGRGASRASRFRPYFMTERMAAEGTSYPFQRLPSDLSDSKVSSVAETESTSAVVDDDEMKLIDHDGIAEETEIISHVDLAFFTVEHTSPSSEDLDSIPDNQSEERDFDSNLPEIKLGGTETQPGLVSDIDEAVNLPTTKLWDTESHPDPEIWMPERAYLIDSAETGPGNTPLRQEIKDNHSSSSLSSLSVEYSSIRGVEVDESLVNVEQRTFTSIGSPDVLAELLIYASNSGHASDVEDDSHTKGPVFDSSPRTVKSHSSSFPSDLLRDASDPDLLQLTNQQKDVLASEKSEVPNEVVEKGNPEPSEMWSSRRLWEVTESGDHDVIKHQFSRVDEHLRDAEASLMPENVVNLALSFSDPELVEIAALENEVLKSEEVHAHLYSINNMGIQVEGQEEVNENIIEMSSSYGALAAERSTLLTPVDVQTRVLETELHEEAMIEEDDLKPQASSFYSDMNADKPKNADANLVAALDERDSVINNSSILAAHSGHEDEGPTIIAGKHENLVNDTTVNENVEYPGLQQPVHDIIPGLSYSGGHTLTEELGDNLIVGVSNPMKPNHENPETGEISDINGIDERLLLELDTVGDFSMKNVRPELNHEGRHSGLPEVYSSMLDPDTFEMKVKDNTSSIDLISLGDDAVMEKQDNLDERNAENLAEFTLPDLVSHLQYINTMSPISRNGPTENIDAAFGRANEPEVEETVITKSRLAEVMREEFQHDSLKSDLLTAASVDPSNAEPVNAKSYQAEVGKEETELGSPGLKISVNETEPLIAVAATALGGCSTQKSVAETEAKYEQIEPSYVESNLSTTLVDDGNVEEVTSESSHAELVVEEIEVGSPSFGILENETGPQIPFEAITIQDHAIQKSESISESSESNHMDIQQGSLESNLLNASAVDANATYVEALSAEPSQAELGKEETQLISPGFKISEDQPQLPVKSTTPEDHAIVKMEKSHVDHLSSDAHEKNLGLFVLQSARYDPSSELVDVTEVSKHGDETVVQHPDTILSQKDGNMSDFVTHEDRSVKDIPTTTEQFHVEINLEQPTSLSVDHGRGGDIQSVNPVDHSPQQSKTEALPGYQAVPEQSSGDNEAPFPETIGVSNVN
ncbi:hypothetical protein Dimus_007523 [Dionaea muscipula]